MNIKAILSKDENPDKLRIQAISIMLVSAWILPFLVHLLPTYQGIPMGAFLLPMFYIPFIAVYFYRWQMGLLVAASGPILNFLITGSPNWEFLAILGFELMVFSLFAFLLIQTKCKILAAPLAYLSAKIVSSFLLIFIPLLAVSPMAFFGNSLTNAAPGLLVLFVLNWILVKKWKK